MKKTSIYLLVMLFGIVFLQCCNDDDPKKEGDLTDDEIFCDLTYEQSTGRS